MCASKLAGECTRSYSLGFSGSAPASQPTENSTEQAAPAVAQASSQVSTSSSAKLSAPACQTGEKVVNEKAVASPAVRRVARELGVNIHQVPGSGKKGRVYKEDVISFNEQGAQVPVQATQSQVSCEFKGGAK